MLKRFWTVGLAGLFLCCFSVGEVQAKAKWTYAVYLDADNNLEDAGVADFLEMAKVGSNADINIVVQFDRASGYDTTYGDWKTCKRFKVTKGMTPTTANATEDLGESNMGSPTTLTNFITWVWLNYPADRYALVLWNHGGGWRDRSVAFSPMDRAVCWDDGNNGDCLYMKEVRTAITNASHTFDLIGFDACLMGHLEVAYELRNVINTADGAMVGSEETEPGDGWPHDTILSWLAANPTATSKQLGSTIVDKYGSSYGTSAACTLACIDITKISDVVGKLNIFADSLNDNSQLTAIQTARTNCKAYSEADGYYGLDIYRFAGQVGGTAASNLKTAVNSAVVNYYRGSARNDTAKYGSYGLCVYFPKTKSYYDTAYTSAILYGSDTSNKWDDFLKRYYDGNLGSGGGSTQTGADGSGTASLSKTGVAPNTYNTSITYTLTPSAAGSLGGGTAEVTIPTAWTSPQNTSSTGKGYVKAYIYKYQTTSYNLTTSVSGQKITITGIPTDRLAYGSGDKLKLSYLKFTTQPSEGTAKFTTKTAGSGGTLTLISKQPSITVGSSYAKSRGDVDVDDEVESEDGGVKQASLGQNYPNPFNPATTFNYFIPEGGRVSIKLYNVAGQEVDTVVDEDQVSGEHSVKYDSGDKLSRGVYYYRLTVNGQEIGTKRAVVLK
ncbi:MAG: T9SS type A sorting domain-containing protein [Elusimicrobia bacterium]|nr:T9SS type A sorting domain-containing protein [Elusimicrobiota bacterium]